MDRKKQVRFNDQYDLKLLKEVVARNPYVGKKGWLQVAASISDDIFTIDDRRARERTSLLVAKFKRDTSESLKQSGVDEDYTEKDVLLQEVVELIDEANQQAVQVKANAKADDAAAKEIRKRAMEGMKKAEDGKPKAKKLNALAYLQAKQETEVNMRQQELDLKKKEIELQQQRFELEREERRAAIEMQKKQHELLMMMMNKSK